MNTRLLKVKNVLNKKGLDAVLVSSVPNITYLTGFSNFSKDEREAFLLITNSNQYIITDGRYSEAISIHVPDFELIERTVSNSLDTIFKSLKKKHRIKKLGIEENNITLSEHKTLQKYFNDLNHFSVELFRAVKEPQEIEAIKKACELGDETFSFVLKKIKPGMTEKELAFEIEFFIKKHGAEIAFPPIVAFGKNSSIPHHQTSNQRLASNGQSILLDFGVKIDNYCSDMTRTVFFGKASDKQKKIYQTVLDAQQKAIEHLGRLTSDGGRLSLRSHDSSEVDLIKAKEVDKIARDYIINQGYPTIPHSLGHGIGLEVHELPKLSPNSKDELKVGMVFSIEPGIYIPARNASTSVAGGPGFGGVRIEDLVVLESRGPRLLTNSPKVITSI